MAYKDNRKIYESDNRTDRGRGGWTRARNKEGTNVSYQKPELKVGGFKEWIFLEESKKDQLKQSKVKCKEN